MKKIIAIALLALSLTACSRQELPTVASTNPGETATSPHTKKTLENRVEAFSVPDKHGVVCYQYLYSSNNLACVKVQ